MAAWYAGAFAVAMAVAGLFLLAGGNDQAEPVRACTAKTLECWRTSNTDILLFAVIIGVLFLLVSLPGSLVALAVMTVSRVRSAMLTGTVAAFAGWFSVVSGVLLLEGVGVPWR